MRLALLFMLLATLCAPSAQAKSAVPSPLDDYFGSLARAQDGDQERALSRLDSQIARLTAKRRRLTLDGPVIVTTIAGSAAVVGGVVAGVSAATSYEPLLFLGSIVAGVGVVGAATGGTWIYLRKGHQADLDREILELKEERESILDGVDYGFDFRAGRRVMTMRIEF